jgi:hypothetical protein
LGLAVAVLFLNMAFATAARAQDVMQLDLMFRDSLQRKTAPETGVDDPRRRQDVSAAHRAINVARRHPRPRRHKKA